MTSTSTATPNERLRQGDVRLLDTDTAQRLLNSAIPARLAFVWTDGTPRITPRSEEHTSELQSPC